MGRFANFCRKRVSLSWLAKGGGFDHEESICFHHNRRINSSLVRLFAKRFPGSAGEQQMLAIGRALMCRPDMLLIDEPSIGLQPSLTIRTFEAIKEINNRGITVLLVEQNVFLSLEISDRAYVLENGRIAMEGKASDLLDNERVRKAYMAL